MAGKKTKNQQPKVKRVTDREAEKMFKRWLQVKDKGGLQQIAREFKRTPITIRRVSIKNNWHDRYEKIQEQVRKDTDKKKAREDIKNVQLLRNLKSAAFKELFRKDSEGKLKLTKKPTIHDVCKIIELEEKIVGDGVGVQETVYVDEGLVSKAINILEALTPDVIKNLAETICKYKPAKDLLKDEQNKENAAAPVD